MFRSLVFLVSIIFIVAKDDSCTTNIDCQLNGECIQGSCSCWKPWTGPFCQLLDRIPPRNKSSAGIYGYNPNTTAWGGNIVKDNATGLHHLYVTDIGADCGLHEWQSHSQVAHAVSSTGPLGPYVKKGIAVPHQSHNPQALQYNSSLWLIFHIFPGAGPPSGNCTPGPPPPPPPPSPPTHFCSSLTTPEGYTCYEKTCGGDKPGVGPNCGPYLDIPPINCTIYDKQCAVIASDICNRTASCHSFSIRSANDNKVQLFSLGNSGIRKNNQWTSFVRNNNTVARLQSIFPYKNSYPNALLPSKETNGSEIHMASSPDGPFTPLQADGYTHCNNPSPWRMSNGTLVVACTWFILTAPRPEGPWSKYSTINISPSTRKGVSGSWEDPFLWQDSHNYWHILSHTYTREGAGPLNSISGHLFSEDLINWHVSPLEPYDNIVTYEDGSKQYFATMERPKLLFNDNGTPGHITNGVSPVYPCNGCGGGVDDWCVKCKVHPGIDWTYTLMQPLNT
eukprot:m.277655 g.277655  ORF g.277655 m.277655 type:complete len:506 (-) comp16312_c0_seq2:50-1567(-)